MPKATRKSAPRAASKSDDAKTLAIVAHLWWIGWIIALILDKDKSPLVRFYLRQLLMLFILSLFTWIPVIGWLLGIVLLIFWIISLIGAISGEQKEVPLVGKYGQDWFKGL